MPTDDLYHQEILDHYHHPDNYGEIKNAGLVIEETNASCGDSFKFYIILDIQKSLPRRQAGKIQNLSFTGTGCAISTAACSLLTSKMKGQPLSKIKNLSPKFMQSLIGAQITPARLKCLMLPAKALKRALVKLELKV
jgi:nitrogen fixation NifU-like protein